MLKTKIDRLKYVKKIMVNNNISNLNDIDKQLSLFNKKDSMPTKRQLDAHIKKYQKLCKGTDVTIDLWGRDIHIKIFWESDNYPSYKICSFEKDKFERSLFDSLSYLEDQILSHIYDLNEVADIITESKEWLKFQQEIDNIIEESNEFEEKYKDFDWHRDILDKYHIVAMDY